MDWPPTPKRGGEYSGPERRAIFAALAQLQSIGQVLTDARRWHQTVGTYVDLGWLLDEWDEARSPSPLIRAQSLPGDLSARLAADWPKGAKRGRDWLSRWTVEHVDGAVRTLRARMAILAQPRLYDRATPPEWVLAQSAPLGDAVGARLLARFHDLPLGVGSVPSVSEVRSGKSSIAQARRANSHREATERASHGVAMEDKRAWAAIGAAVSRLPAPATAPALARALPPGWTVGVRSPRPGQWVATVGIGAREYRGVDVASEWDAVPALARLADAIQMVPVSAVAIWRAHVAGARQSLSAGAERSNPLTTPAGVSTLASAARAAGFEGLAGWFEAHAPDVGALVTGRVEWAAPHATGWRTQARATGTQTRADLGWAEPEDIVQLRARTQARGAPAPGFEHWHDRGARRAIGRWDGTTGALSPPEWREMVGKIAAGGVREPVTVTRTHAGELLVDGIERAYAALDAQQTSVPTRFMYEDGSERWGLIAVPGSGSFEPFPPGRRIAYAAESGGPNSEGRAGTVTRRVFAGGFLPEDAIGIRLDAGDSLIAHPRELALRNEAPARLRPNPAPAARLAAYARSIGLVDLARFLANAPALASIRANPSERVRVGWAANKLGIRACTAGARVVARPRTALLEGAGPAGDVIEGVLASADGPVPPALGRWVARDGVPGEWLAVEDSGSPGRYFVVGHPSIAERAALGAAPIRFNRAVSGEVAGEGLYDAEGRRYTVVYQVVEAALDGSTLATSHQPSDLSQWTPGYPREFQTRDLGTPEETAKIRTIARGLDPERLIGRNLDATLGPPVAWEGADGRLYVLGGNGRALAILTAADPVYAAYERAGRRAWSCWPREPARPGYRWVLVRVVESATRADAAQLAAASQASTSAEEGRLGKALGLVRSLRLDLSRLPPVRWLESITAANATEFARENAAFTESVLSGLDPAKRASYLTDADRLGPLLESVLLGFLPAELQRAGLLHDPKLEDALLGALPGMVTVRGAVESGEVYPAFDLLTALPRAIGVFEHLRAKRLSFRSFEAELDAELRTERIGDVERLSDTPDLSLALAAALYNAARRGGPAVVMSGFIAAYYEEAARYNPRQAGLWARSHPDPAQVLVGVVGTFRLPERARQNPAPALALLFDRETFASASDARGWLKSRGHHAGVPVAWGPWWLVGPEPSRAVRQVPLAPGVLALA